MITIGSVCICQHGIVGIVTVLPKQGKSRRSREYKGITLQGRPWTSVSPTLVAATVQDFLVKGYNDGRDAGYAVAVRHARQLIAEIF